jgi:hypothetical protein
MALTEAPRRFHDSRKETHVASMTGDGNGRAKRKGALVTVPFRLAADGLWRP